MSKDLLLHNNFGICEQVEVKASVEGLGRIRAIHQSSDYTLKAVESEFAEIAVYKKLETTKPDVASYFTDLYSKTQVG
jgi:hypothetical protein